jgi:hypothetical protein
MIFLIMTGELEKGVVAALIAGSVDFLISR